jgi:hypothetical protein
MEVRFYIPLIYNLVFKVALINGSELPSYTANAGEQSPCSPTPGLCKPPSGGRFVQRSV